MAVCSQKVSSFLKRAAACAVGLAAVFAAGGARAETYWLAGNDGMGASSITGAGNAGGWSNGKKYAESGLDYGIKQYYMRTPDGGGDCTFPGRSLEFVNGSIAIKLANGKTLTIPRLIVSGTGGIASSSGSSSYTLAGDDFEIREGGVLSVYSNVNGTTDVRNMTLSATVRGAGQLKLYATGNTTTRETFVKVSGDLSGFTGRLLVYRTGNHPLQVWFTETGKWLGNPSVLDTLSVTVTNNATLRFDADVTSGDNRGFFFGGTSDVPGKIYVAEGKTVTIEGPISCEKGFEKTGAGKLVLAKFAASTDTSKITVTEGTVEVDNTLSSIVIGSSSEEYGTVAPDYGSISSPVPGQEYVFTCTQTEELLMEGLAKAICTGWALYRTVDNVPIKSSQDDGELPYVCRHTYVKDEGVKLVWQWEVEYKVRASADAGATVSVSEQWVKAGGTFTSVATVTDPATQVFSRWLDGADNVVSRDATLNVTITEPRSFTAKLGYAHYVGSGATDYASVAEACDAARDYDTIYIRTGTYSMANVCSVTNAVIIRSVSGNPADVILTMPDNAGYRHFILNHADGAFFGLTFTNGSYSAEKDVGGSVAIRAFGGTISNCVFTGNANWSSGGKGGAVAVNSAEALVTHCTFTRNRVGDSDVSGGNSVYISSGAVRNCLFAGNGERTDGGGYCGTVFATGGTVENCTFVNNANKYCAGVSVNSATPTIKNCVFYGADCPNASSELQKIMKNTSYASAFSYCCAPVLINDVGTCIASDNPFVDAAHGDWTPSAVIVDKGVSNAWMACATDLAGNPRISGTAPDIGCYEKDQSEFGASVEPSGTSGIAPYEVAFTVTTYGTVTDGITCYWDWDGDGTWDGEPSAGTTSHVYQVGTYSTKVKVVDNATQKEYAPPSPFAITAVPKTIHVDAASTEPVSPYGDPAHAAQTVAAAYAVAQSGCEIVIANGTYSSSSTIEMTKGVRFRSVSGNPADVILTMPDNAGYRHFILNHADGAFSGLTFTNGSYSAEKDVGGSVAIGAFGGTISNCVFTGNANWSWGGKGGAVAMNSADALVTHCTFTRNRVGNADTSGGNSVYISSGAVRNCLFAGNGERTDGGGYCGTVFASGGTVESCTFVTNANKYCAGVSVHSANSTVRNCLFYGADCPSASSELQKIMQYTANSNNFSYCCAPVLINDGGTCVVTDDPQFRNEARGDYRLKATSPAVDKGAKCDWMENATDLSGRPRIIHKIPDIGCYEAPGSGFTLIVR